MSFRWFCSLARENAAHSGRPHFRKDVDIVTTRQIHVKKDQGLTTDLIYMAKILGYAGFPDSSSGYLRSISSILGLKKL
jgi:hypothetical protein